MREIGSEFWIGNEPERLLTERDGVYCLSGRTAIDLVLQDILKRRAVRSVAMPAWCCDSMVEPFARRNIRVEFYDVAMSGERLSVIGYRLAVSGERLAVSGKGHTEHRAYVRGKGGFDNPRTVRHNRHVRRSPA